MEINTIDKFGKDHWSLLVYVEYRVLNHRGALDRKHLRISNVALQKNLTTGMNLWKPEYGTRLSGYWNEDKTTNKGLLLLDHDDYDCLDDLEEAGLVKNFGSALHPGYILTKEGIKVCGLLLEHKQAGLQYASFVLSDKEKTTPTGEQDG